MKKLTKSLVTGIAVLLLTAGTVYAICRVWSGSTNRTVTEALEVGWVQPFPPEVLPGQTHDVKLSIINKTSAPTQNVKVDVTLEHLEKIGVSVDGIGMGWGYDGSVFSMAPDEEKHIIVRVKIPGGYDPADGNVDVHFVVNRVN